MLSKGDANAIKGGWPPGPPPPPPPHVFVFFYFHKIYKWNTGKCKSNLKIAYSWNVICFCRTQILLHAQASNSNSIHFVFIISSDKNSMDPLTFGKDFFTCHETWIFYHLNHISHAGDLLLAVFDFCHALLLCTINAPYVNISTSQKLIDQS